MWGEWQFVQQPNSNFCSMTQWHLRNGNRHFYKHTKLAIMTLMPTLYTHIAAFFLHYRHHLMLVESNSKIRCQLLKRDYLSRLQILFVFLIMNSMAKIKLTILEFLYCRKIYEHLINALSSKKGRWYQGVDGHWINLWIEFHLISWFNFSNFNLVISSHIIELSKDSLIYYRLSMERFKIMFDYSYRVKINFLSIHE